MSKFPALHHLAGFSHHVGELKSVYTHGMWNASINNNKQCGEERPFKALNITSNNSNSVTDNRGFACNHACRSCRSPLPLIPPKANV
ncbi:hypothetical protein BC938DRAFT_474310 [Jimgerdemannia flammicorona]|uniref:Uncharacterized protein n=1 Tax=Jimgerdemannia flammicorona TaxID=994334 RepID=A0A433Q2I4_9FUNG|nr:hypothetical protein BC938DRAFT_474310 [Jimgerdemannia flammicorona]